MEAEKSHPKTQTFLGLAAAAWAIELFMLANFNKV